MAARKPEDVFGAVEQRQKQLEKQWLSDARKVVQIYEAEDNDGGDQSLTSVKTPFNILYSNTETLLPAVYNSTPRPEVARRYTGSQEVRILDMAVSQVSERVLEYAADTNDGEYQTYDDACQDAVLGALVPGQGQVRVRFKQEGQYQATCFDSVDYDRFIWAYARKWCNVPWVAFGHDLNQADFLEQFPAMKDDPDYKKINWKERVETLQPPDPNASKDSTKKEPTLLVWEVHFATTKEIKWVCEDFKKKFLLEEEYPFALTTRFPCPEPLKFFKRNGNLTPVPIYKLYEKQARELNRISTRIDRVVNALRVRGAYNGQMTELEQILSEDTDNALVAVENASLMDGSGFDKHIWLLPIEKLVTVLRELYIARDACKQTIYEITGIGDVIRGATDPGETAKAQTIKNQWGTLRMKRIQKDTQTFCLALFRITLEFAANLYTPLTFKQVTQLELPMMATKQAAQQKIAMLKSAPPGPPGPDGQPAPPPQPSQDEVLAANLPAWEEVVGILQDKFERTYRIDVETNSTVDLEATEDKAAIGEFMNAFGQMAAGLQPLVESGVLPFEASKTIMQEVFRRFRFGRRVESALEQMQQPPPPQDNGAKDELHKAQMMKVQADAAKAMEASERKVLEMQETVTEVTGTNERLKIQLEQGKLKQSEITASSALTQKQLHADGQAKLRDATDKHRNEVAGLHQQKMVDGAKLISKDLDAKVVGLEQKLGEVQKAKQPNPVVDQMLPELQKMTLANDKMMTQLEAQNKRFEEMVTQLLKVMASPRKLTLTKGPKGETLGGSSTIG